MKNQTFKRILSLILVVVMISGLAGFSAFADDNENGQAAGIETNSPGQSGGGGDETYDETTNETPAETSEEPPTETPVETPEEIPDGTPDETPEETSGETFPEVPNETPNAEEPVFANQVLTLVVNQTRITISGLMPVGAFFTAFPVDVTLESGEVLAAFDITILDKDWNPWQPDGSVRVAFDSPELAAYDEVTVYHMAAEGAALDYVGTVSVAGTEAAFKAESFSIYIVTSETKLATYVFKDGTDTVSTQIVKNGDTLVEPEAPEKAGYKFIGWFNGSTQFTDFGITLAGITETEIVTLTAKFDQVYHVIFLDREIDGTRRIVETREGVVDGAGVSTTDIQGVTLVGNEGVTGWSETLGGSPVGANVTSSGANITLYPIIKNGHWITFDTQGGSFINPVFVESNANTSKPTDPTRVGYTFDKWKNGAANFNFGSKLTGDITLTATWKANTNTKYTVIHWQQNADDNEYSFKESETKTGKTGNNTSASAKSYTYFNAKAVTQKTIEGDGSTIINIYYDRIQYTLTFIYNSNTVKKITAKYDQNISAYWPIVGTNGTKYNGYDWSDSSGKTFSYALVTLERMPGADVTFTGRYRGTQKNIYYYVEALPGTADTVNYSGKNYALYKEIPNNFNYITRDEEFHDIDGFMQYTSNPGFGWDGKANFDRNNKISLYYTRETYSIKFYNGSTITNTVNKLYEDSLNDVSYTPPRPAGVDASFTFQGWYSDEQCSGEEYVFAGRIMPAKNLVLYAKWVAPEFTVTFDAAGGSPTPSMQTVGHGEKATAPSVPTLAGSTFAGWFYKEGTIDKLFSFDTNITKNYSLTAHWSNSAELALTYDLNGGTGTIPEDTNKYAPNSSAVVKMLGSVTNSTKVFVGWKSSSDNNIYYPGSTVQLANASITLVAQWAEPAETTKITYKSNYSGGAADIDSDVLVNNGEATLLGIGAFIRGGYTLTGWNTAADGNGDSFALGATVRVDTNGNNILFAQWKKVVTYAVSYKLTTDDAPSSYSAIPAGGSYPEGETVFIAGGLTTSETTKEGVKGVWTFNGWTTEDVTPDGDGKFAMPANAVTFTGSWSFAEASTNPGRLTITKTFTGLDEGTALPASVTFTVTGTNYNKTVELDGTESTPWSATLSGLAAGTYIITESGANVNGYTNAVTYGGNSTPEGAVTLALGSYNAETNSYTVIDATVTATNSYTKNEEDGATNPAALTITKIDSGSEKTPLAGAGFTVYGENGEVYRPEQTTNASGQTTFTFNEAGTYTLKETTTPANYQESSETWRITVTKSGAIRTDYNAGQNVFQRIYEWLIGIGNNTPANAAALTVENTLIPTYTVTYEFRDPAPAGVEPPTDGNIYPEDTLVTVLGNPVDVRGTNGTWKFVSWDKTNFYITVNTTIIGTWRFESDPIFNYGVTYHANNGTGDTKADEENNASYATTFAITANDKPAEFTKANHTFGGWANEPGGNAVLQPGAKINLVSTAPHHDLYAVWVENDKYAYSLTYDGKGGVLGDGNTSYADSQGTTSTYDTTWDFDVDQNIFTRKDYTFLGWEDKDGIPYNKNMVTLTAEKPTMTLYAVWKQNTYTVEVTKAVTGAALPADFYITLTRDGGEENPAPESPEPQLMAVVPLGTVLDVNNADSFENGVYRWLVEDVTAGTYTATEHNYTIAGMNWSGNTTASGTVTEDNIDEGEEPNIAGSFVLTNTYTPIYIPGPIDPGPSPSEPPETEIPETDPPLNPSPDPSEDPGTDIPEESPPLGPGTGGTDIPDAETPVDAAPQTGDNSRVVPFAILSLLSAFGIAALGFLGRKKKHN